MNKLITGRDKLEGGESTTINFFIYFFTDEGHK